MYVVVDVVDVVVVLCDVLGMRMALWNVVEILRGKAWFSCTAVILKWA